MRWFNVGKIVNTHGLKGEVKVLSMTDFPEQRFQTGSHLTFFSKEGAQNSLTIQTHRRHKNFELLSFEGYSSVEEAEKLKGGMLKVSETQRMEDELEDHEYYYHEIIGCKVFSEDNEELGTVKEILSPGANDVWVVEGKANIGDLYIPYIEPVVKSINVYEKKIIIHVLEGLIE